MSFVINVEDLERAIRSKNIDDTRAKLKQYTILKSLSRNTANLVDDIFGRRPCVGNHIIYFLMKNKSWLKKIFLSAAESGNLCTLKLLCDNGFIEMAQDNKKLLFSAIGYERIEFCRNLIEQKMFMEAENPDLVYAIILEDKGAIESLINSGNGKCKLFGKYTETMIAAGVGNLDIFMLFPKSSRPVRPLADEDCSITNLQCASQNGSIKIVNFILDENYEYDKCCYDDWWDREYALYKAINFDQYEVASLLLDNGATINWIASNEARPLVMACRKGNIEIAQLLMRNGPDLNQREICDHRSPLEAACTSGSLELIELLLAYGAEIDGNEPDEILYWTSLMEATCWGHLHVIEFLADLGADIHVQIDDGRTPLIEAARLGYIEIVKWFVSQKVNINVKDEDGLTAADYAAKKGYTEILAFLLANGATQEVTN